MNGFWVFGYGSLMWNPGFPYQEAVPAELIGYHRSLCIYSTHYRGTPEQPGLVLGLDQGGSCAGTGFFVGAQDAQKTYDYLIAREQVTGVYQEKQVELRLEDGRTVAALTFVVDPDHRQYAGNLNHAKIYELVASSKGIGGPNRDYVLNTVEYLRKVSVKDPILEEIAARLEQ